MTVKKYRAPTTREALEMVKRELGEDAFVLETKRIRKSGFLGLRPSLQIEVSAAAPSNVSGADRKRRAKPEPSTPNFLDLSSDTYSQPKNVDQPMSTNKQNLISALSARAHSSSEFDRNSLKTNGQSQRETARVQPRFESVEVTSDAPRIIHAKKEPARQEPEVTATPMQSEIEVSTPAATGNEIDLIRAELREIKFSLGAYSNRNASQPWQSDVDLDLFGEIFESPFYDTYFDLMATGVSAELARDMVAAIIPDFKNQKLDKSNLTRATLLRGIYSMIKFVPDAVRHEHGSRIALIGPTGVGKTTTIAKLAARVSLHEHRRVELVTLDTYRIAAVEQLKTYAEIIGAGCHVVRSVFELDAVLSRFQSDVTVLIDTTGRNPHDLADQYELSEFLLNRSDIRKCLTIQATTHPIEATAAVRKFEMYGVDCITVAKLDETMRPGSVIETIADSHLPLAYFCVGQRVPEDLNVATAESLTDRILGKRR